MAKFVIEYNIHLGDIVRFKQYEVWQEGIVQDISQLPDVFVEGADNATGLYNRWRIGIDSLELIYSEHDDSGKWSSVEIDDNENVEFVHKGDVGTPEFNEIEYTNYMDFKKKWKKMISKHIFESV